MCFSCGSGQLGRAPNVVNDPIQEPAVTTETEVEDGLDIEARLEALRS